MPILVLKDKRYEFDAMQFTNLEAMAIEKATGYTWQEWLDKAGNGVLATTALVWMVRRRAGENVAFSDVVFSMEDVTFELDDEQKRRVEEAAAAAEAEENPTQDGNPSGVGLEASPPPRSSTSSRSRKSSASTSGTTTA